MTIDVAATSSGAGVTDGSSQFTVTMPSGTGSGDRLVAIVALDLTGTAPSGWPTGWNQIVHEPRGTGNNIEVREKFLSASESDFTLTSAAASGNGYLFYVLRVTGAHASQAGEGAGFDAGSTLTPDPPNLTPSWGSDENLWIAAVMAPSGTNVTAYPTGYTDDQHAFNNGIPGSIGAATKTATASSDNPGTFTWDTSRVYVAVTVAIRGAGAAPASEGTSSITLANVTASATGVLDIQGAASITLGAVTSSATGVRDVEGDSSITLAPTTLVATGVLDIIGTASITLAPATLAATGVLDIEGESSIQLANATLIAAGVLDIQGLASITLDPTTVAATGELTRAGTLSITLDAVTVTAAGQLTPFGILEVNLDALTAAGTAVLSINGQAAILLDDVTVAALTELGAKTGRRSVRLGITESHGLPRNALGSQGLPRNNLRSKRLRH